MLPQCRQWCWTRRRKKQTVWVMKRRKSAYLVKRSRLLIITYIRDWGGGKCAKESISFDENVFIQFLLYLVREFVFFTQVPIRQQLVHSLTILLLRLISQTLISNQLGKHNSKRNGEMVATRNAGVFTPALDLMAKISEYEQLPAVHV